MEDRCITNKHFR